MYLPNPWITSAEQGQYPSPLRFLDPKARPYEALRESEKMRQEAWVRRLTAVMSHEDAVAFVRRVNPIQVLQPAEPEKTSDLLKTRRFLKGEVRGPFTVVSLDRISDRIVRSQFQDFNKALATAAADNAIRNQMGPRVIHAVVDSNGALYGRITNVHTNQVEILVDSDWEACREYAFAKASGRPATLPGKAIPDIEHSNPAILEDFVRSLNPDPAIKQENSRVLPNPSHVEKFKAMASKMKESADPDTKQQLDLAIDVVNQLRNPALR